MIIALATDLVAASHDTVVMWNDRLGAFPSIGAKLVLTRSNADERALLPRYSPEVDWTIIIAPETGGILAERCRWVESAGGRLLGCSSQLVELLAVKQRTVEHLAAGGVPTPRGQAWSPGEPAAAPPCPVVVKPHNGAGAAQTFLVQHTRELHTLLANYKAPARIEEYVPGVPCSVSFLCGPRGCFPLMPTSQRIAFERFAREDIGNDSLQKIVYCGGRLPLPADLSARATRLASRAVQTLPDPLGYLGVDIVLGHRSDGGRDFVIEINPRLTTSYVGLRRAARSNLANWMIEVAGGRVPPLSFNGKPIEFDADGTIRMGDES
jgi:tyramine---L-glutamate ligase